MRMLTAEQRSTSNGTACLFVASPLGLPVAINQPCPQSDSSIWPAPVVFQNQRRALIEAGLKTAAPDTAPRAHALLTRPAHICRPVVRGARHGRPPAGPDD